MFSRWHMQSRSIFVKLKIICVDIKGKGRCKILIAVYLGGRSVHKSLFFLFSNLYLLKWLLITLLGWKKSWMGWRVWVVRIKGIAPTCRLPHLGRLGLEVLVCSFSRAYMSSIALQRKFRIGHLLLILWHVFSLFHSLFSLELQSISKSVILWSIFTFFMYIYTYVFLFMSFPTSLKMGSEHLTAIQLSVTSTSVFRAQNL